MGYRMNIRDFIMEVLKQKPDIRKQIIFYYGSAKVPIVYELEYCHMDIDQLSGNIEVYLARNEKEEERDLERAISRTLNGKERNENEK